MSVFSPVPNREAETACRDGAERQTAPMSQLRTTLAFLFVLTALLRSASGQLNSQAPTNAPSSTSTREWLTSDTPRTTPDGAKFIAPGGWWFETRGKAVI